jgi:hypothetical protein
MNRDYKTVAAATLSQQRSESVSVTQMIGVEIVCSTSGADM